MNESLNKRMVWVPQKGHSLVIYQFGCRISKMVGPKKQGFLAKNQHGQRKPLYFVNTINDRLSKIEHILENKACQNF